MKWTDSTSYSRGERGNVEPRCWDLRAGDLRLTVHRLHGCDGWFGSCHQIGIERAPLDSSDLADAQAEFFATVLGKARGIVQALELLGEPKEWRIQ